MREQECLQSRTRYGTCSVLRSSVQESSLYRGETRETARGGTYEEEAFLTVQGTTASRVPYAFQVRFDTPFESGEGGASGDTT